jgi:hypothetical protein
MPIVVTDKVNESLSGRSGTGFRNNALDTISTTFTLELNTTLNLSGIVQVVKLGNTFTLTSGNWSDIIASFNGATIDFRLGKGQGNNPTQSTTVTIVDGIDMTLASDGGYDDGPYSVGFFQITSAPAQFDFLVNLVQNSVGSGTASLIDSEAVRFSATLVNALTISGLTDDLIQLGNKSGGSQFTTTTIERIADATNLNKQYRLIVVYKNWLCIDSTPYFSSEAVGDFYDFQAFMIAGDPSVLVPGTYFQSGNTGFEDESFNGFPKDYTLSSIVWTDNDAIVMEAFDFDQESNFTITITSAKLNLADSFNFKMFTIPNDATEYQNKPNPVENNLMLAINPTLIPDSTPTNITGNLNDSGAGFDIQNLNFAVTAGVDVIITGKVVPNSDFSDLFTSRDVSDRAYKIWIQCEDTTASFNDLNTVNVVADDTQSKENIKPLGSWGGVSVIEIEDHNKDIYVGTPDLYLEDDALVNVEFTLPKDITGNPWLSIRVRMVARRLSVKERFILEEFVYDTSGIPTNTSTGILPLSYTQNRGFKLPATSDKHDITIGLFPSLDTVNDFGVQIRYPFIVRYENWLPLPQASDEFYGVKTQNWFTYSNDPDWVVQFELSLEVAKGEYNNDLVYDIHTYDDWAELPGSSFSFKKLDDTPITKPFASQSVKVTATHEIDAEDWNGNEWGVIHVRPEFGAPQWLIGTVLDHSDNSNPLLPSSGETKGKLTVGTKIITIEAVFDPSKDIDVSGDITFTSRVSGSTTGGIKGNIYKESYRPAKSFLIPQIRHQNEVEEDRGYKGCCDPLPVIADETNATRNNNDIAFPRAFGDSVTFTLTKDGVPTIYTPVAIQFPNEPDAWYAQIEWRDVLISDGEGCYSIDMIPVVAGNLSLVSFNYGKYSLKPYNKDGYLHAKYTARILSQFNNVNDLDGINYTDSFALESLRISNGKFGYFDPKTEVDKVEYLDGTNEPVKTEDFFEYELRISGITRCTATPLLAHLRGMTNCWMSSYNYDDFDYADLSMKNVILSEGFTPEHIDGSRMINGAVKFQDKVFNSRAHFQDNRQTAEASQPPDVCPPAQFRGSAQIMKTGQTVSYRAGDDGDFEYGREVDFLTLPSNNVFGDTFRFTDELGTQVFANDIVIDHSTDNGIEILGWRRTEGPSSTSWNNAIDGALLVTVGVFDKWRLPNINELKSLMNIANTKYLDYFPFNIISSNRYWSGSTQSNDTIRAFLLGNTYSININATLKATATSTYKYIPCRPFTYAELGV